MKEKFKTFRENLSLIILIPTILGGLWQFISLADISMSYIRFFSLTQLVVDGILILSILFLIILPSYLASWVMNEKDIQKSNKVSRVIKFILTVILGVFFIITTIIGIKKTGYIDPFNLAASTALGTMIISIILFYVRKIKLKRQSKFYFVGYIMVFVLGYIIHLASTTFNESYLIPKNLKNFRVLKKQLINQNEGSVINLKYFNDKYFFFEIKRDSVTEIEILKFENLIEK